MAVLASYGTVTTLDTLRANFQNIAQIGEDTAWAGIEAALAAHNRIVDEISRDFMEVTSQRLRRFGAAATMKMVKLDEFGVSDAQKIIAAQVVGFPLESYGVSVQWTRKALLAMTGNELANQFTAAMDADMQAIITGMKKAIFLHSNYLSVDRLVDHLQAIPLPVKALVNADGGVLPPGPNGEIFNGATHTHYLGVATPATLAATDLTGLVNTVVEHFGAGRPRIFINRADETAVRSLVGFVPLLDARVIPQLGAGGTGVVIGPGQPALDVVQIYNRMIGIFAGAEVWVKPWMIAGYQFAYVDDQPKPVVMRIRDEGANLLALAAEDESHPLRAREFEREMGFGIWNRVNGAVLCDSSSTYVDPVL